MMSDVETFMAQLTAACEAWHSGLPANDVVRLCENDTPHLIAELLKEGAEMKQDLKRIGDVLDAVKSQECQGHYSTMIQQIIDRNKELEEGASIHSWIASNCRVTYNGKTIYDEAQIKRYMENT